MTGLSQLTKLSDLTLEARNGVRLHGEQSSPDELHFFPGVMSHVSALRSLSKFNLYAKYADFVLQG